MPTSLTYANILWHPMDLNVCLSTKPPIDTGLCEGLNNSLKVGFAWPSIPQPIEWQIKHRKYKGVGVVVFHADGVPILGLHLFLTRVTSKPSPLPLQPQDALLATNGKVSTIDQRMNGPNTQHNLQKHTPPIFTRIPVQTVRSEFKVR